MAHDPTPVVRAHLGKHFSRVIAESTYAFDPRRIEALRDRSVLVIEGPSQLAYDDPEIGFTLPEGRHVWLSVAAGRVMEIVAGANAQPMTLGEAHARAVTIAEALSSLPFAEPKPALPTLAEVRWELDQVTSDGYEIPLARYRFRDAQWTLRLSWLGKSAPSPRDAYVVSMRWSSEALEDELVNQVLDKRLEHGDEDQALPLSAWMKGS
ncbi:MAG: hypothetical protein QM820_57715 [Minicystis sp.]